MTSVTLTQTLTLPPIRTTRPPQIPVSRETRTPKNILFIEPQKLTSRSSSDVRRIDPEVLLEPNRKKLSTLEAQRIMAVITEVINKTEIISVLPYVMKKLNDFKVCFGVELTRILLDHKTILNQFSEFQEDEVMECESAEVAVEIEAHYVKENNTEEGQPVDPREEERHQPVDESEEEEEQEDSSTEEEQPAAEPSGVEPESSDNLNQVSTEAEYIVSEDQTTEIVLESDKSAEEDKDDSTSVAKVENRQETEQPEVEQETLPLSKPDRTPKKVGLIAAATLQHSTRALLRAFSKNPAAVKEILRFQTYSSPSAKQLLQNLSDLREFIKLKLLTTPVDEVEKEECLKDLSKKAKTSSEANEKLAEELTKAEQERDDDISKQNETIRHLQNELHRIEKTSEYKIKNMKQEGEKLEADEIRISEVKKVKLNHDITLVATQHKNLLQEHRETELALRKRKFQIETEIESWIERYDRDMGDKQDEYDHIDFLYTEEKKKLNELEERFRALEVEYKNIQASKQAAQEVREAAERQLMLAIRAATTIQAFWRSFKVRKAIKSKKKTRKSANAKPKK